jgi:hypothetical protein
MYKEQKLDEIIEEMRNVGEVLVPYNYPKGSVNIWGDQLIIFKEREAIIDGYPVIIHYQKSDYDDHFLETLQIFGKNSPFLPFNLICKLAKRFLGSHHLSLIEVFRDSRKLYVWAVCVDKKGRPIPSPYDSETEPCEFEGFNYLYMQPNQADFF